MCWVVPRDAFSCSLLMCLAFDFLGWVFFQDTSHRCSHRCSSTRRGMWSTTVSTGLRGVPQFSQQTFLILRLQNWSWWFLWSFIEWCHLWDRWQFHRKISTNGELLVPSHFNDVINYRTEREWYLTSNRWYTDVRNRYLWIAICTASCEFCNLPSCNACSCVLLLTMIAICFLKWYVLREKECCILYVSEGVRDAS